MNTPISHNNISDNIELITVCPKKNTYITQLQLLNFTLSNHGMSHPLVFTPSFSSLTDTDLENNVVKVDIGAQNTDIYFEKFAITAIGNETNKKFFLYLDPDHIIFKKINLQDLAENIIWLSSETNTLGEYLSSEELEAIRGLVSINEDDIFYNTSFIYSNVSYFIQFVPYWLEVYNFLYSKVGSRHLEEISLSIACRKYGFHAQPVPTAIQGNIKTGAVDSQIFHYGGEHDLCYKIKNIVAADSGLSEIKKIAEIKELINVFQSKFYKNATI